jgi:hypothetical protein
MHRPTCIFWANLTPFLLQRQQRQEEEEEEAEVQQQQQEKAVVVGTAEHLLLAGDSALTASTTLVPTSHPPVKTGIMAAVPDRPREAVAMPPTTKYGTTSTPPLTTTIIHRDAGASDFFSATWYTDAGARGPFYVKSDQMSGHDICEFCERGYMNLTCIIL